MMRGLLPALLLLPGACSQGSIALRGPVWIHPEARAVKGVTSEYERTDVRISRIRFVPEGKPERVSAGKFEERFRVRRRIDEVADGRSMREFWRVHEAWREKDGQRKTWGFEGRDVELWETPEGTWKYTYAGGGELTLSDSLVLHDAGLGDGKGTPQVQGFMRPFLPGRPVRVGESWGSNPMRLIAQSNLNETHVDLDRTHGDASLVWAERRNGVLVGRVEGRWVLSLKEVEGFVLDAPLPMNVTFRWEGCLDGALPARRVELRMKCRGERAAAIRGEKGTLEMELDLLHQSGDRLVGE